MEMNRLEVISNKFISMYAEQCKLTTPAAARPACQPKSTMPDSARLPATHFRGIERVGPQRKTSFLVLEEEK